SRSPAAQRRPSGAASSKGRRRAAPKRPRWKKVLLVLAGLFLAGVLVVAGLVAWAYANTDIPDPNEFAESQSSIIYNADGETELARFTGGYNRESVPLSQVPEHVQRAMLAAEDRDFYENQ